MPKNIAEFMTEATGQYFSKFETSAKNKDFVSASEFSPLFAEVVADWAIQKWKKNACPNPVQLVELGPGRGLLMRRVLDYIEANSPDFFSALRVVLLEHSDDLKKIQKETLTGCEKLKTTQWISEIKQLPMLPFIMFANEFFDCLPIHQVVKTEMGFRERLVDGKKFTLSEDQPSYLTPYMAREHFNAIDGSVIELCPYAVYMINFITERIARSRSAMMIIDYGYEEPQTTETLQAVKDGKFYPILEAAGDADITAHVDFSALRSAALQGHVKVYGPLRQGIWLKKMKIEEKAQKAMDKSSDKDKKQIQENIQKLTSFNKMGNSFKVMVFSSRL